MNQKEVEFLTKNIGSAVSQNVESLLTQKLNNLISIVQPAVPMINFFEFAENHIKKLKLDKRNATAIGYHTTIYHLANFLHSKNLFISEINSSFVFRFYDYLLRDCLIKDDTAKAYLTGFRVIFNVICRVYDIDKNPFKNISLKRKTKRGARALTLDQLQRFWRWSPRSEKAHFAKNVFFLSFALCGCNLCDLYTMQPTQNQEYIAYKRQKTRNRRDDEAFIKIKVPDCIKAIYNSYKSHYNKNLFNFCCSYSSNGEFLKAVNKGLKECAIALNLPINLSSYYARHSWATIARNECNIDMADISSALNHVDNSHIVDNIYIKQDFSRIDRANALVCEIVFTDKIYQLKAV